MLLRITLTIIKIKTVQNDQIIHINIQHGLSIYAKEQSQKEIYIYFEENSTEICNIPNEQKGRYHGDKKIEKYKKIKSSDSNKDSYQFYVCNELFIFENEKRIKKCGTNYLDNVQFSNIKDLIVIVNNKNPLYPFKVFPNIYIVEKANEKEIFLYKVKWQHYVE